MRFSTLIAFLLLSLSGFAAPVITSFTPASAATGTTVTINGTGFTGVTAVSFGGTPAASFNVVSSVQITAVVASGSSGSVFVTAGTTTSKIGFNYLPLSGIITDFGGMWSTTTASPNSTIPNNSHNLLAFTYNGTTYSTGVNNSTLTTNGITYTSGSYKSVPVAGITGTNSTGLATYLALAKNVDGNGTSAVVSAVATKSIKSVMTDGTNGLDLGTGVTNLPTTATLEFNIYSIDPTKITDAEPDILITQIASPVSSNDIFSFVDAAGTVVGNSKSQDMTLLSSLGTYDLDLFTLPNTSFNSATIVGVNSPNTNREIRLVGFKLSDFGITSANVSQVKTLRITPSGNSDYAFIAYNANAINLPPNISNNDGSSTTTNCATSPFSLSVIGSAASSGTLTYSWQRSVNGGTSWSTVTNGSGFSTATTATLGIAGSAAVNGNMYRAIVTESSTGYSNTGASFTLTVYPVSAGGTIAGTATVCSGTNSSLLTLSGYTGSIVRWESSVNNFTTTSTIANTTTSLTASNLSATTKYRAVLQSGTCATANSAIATITVNPASVGGSIAGSASVCSGTNTTPLTLSGHSGTVLRWESSTDNFSSVVTSITNTTTSLSAVNLTSNMQYRAVVQNGSCATANSSTASVTVTANQWIGGSSGNWNNAANWCGGIPTLATSISIPTGSVVNITAQNGAVKSVTIASGASLVMSGSFNLSVAPGGSFTNSGTFDGSASTGAVSFLGGGTISGTTGFQNIEANGALDFGTASTINGIFTLQPGGSVTGHSPTYACPSSTLTYNTGGVYVRNLEWPSVSSGQGLPSNVDIKGNTIINFPAAGAGYICNDLLIESGSSLLQNYSGSASLTVGRHVTISGTLSLGNNNGDDITLSGNWTRTTGGDFDDNGRTVKFAGSGNSTITAPSSAIKDENGAFGGETFYSVNINKSSSSNSVALGSNAAVLNELKLTKGVLDLSNSNLTLVSNAFNTAHIAAIPASGATINYSGTGKFVVQRNLPIGTGSESRRWRLLTSPLQTVGAPTISEAWQEGAANADRNSPVNPWPGFGTTITKNTTYNAADGYDQGSTNNPSIYTYLPGTGWTAVPSTKVSVTTNEGYMLFARGDRSIVVSTAAINASPTTLEPKGKVNVGNVVKTLTTGSQIIGNPYASSINFSKVSINNYTSNGTTFNNTTAGDVAGITYYIFDPKTSGTSGVGKFITCSSNGTGTFDVTSNNSGLQVDGTIESSSAIIMRAENTGGTLTFHETDKLTASSTVGMASRAAALAQLTTSLFAGTGQTALLTDGVINSYHLNYQNSVNGQDAPKINSFNSKESISIARDGKSLAIERRSPITAGDTIFLNLSGMSKTTYSFRFAPKNLDLKMTAFLEDKFTGVAKPISVTDTTFIAFAITTDANSFAADRFRIVFAKAKTPLIALPGLTPVNDKPVITVSPNPVRGGNVKMQLQNLPAGNYKVTLVTDNGQVVARSTIKHDGGKAAQTIASSTGLAAGTYRVEIAGAGGKTYSVQLMIAAK